MNRFCLTAWLLPGLLLLLAGCRGEVRDMTEAASSTVERGPVTATLSIRPKQARLSDQLEMRLAIEFETGVEVAKVPFGESLSEFEIRSFDESPDRLVPSEDRGKAERRMLEQSYMLEPTHAGELSVAPVTIKFTDNRPIGDGKEHELQTDPVTVSITTMLGDAAPSLADLRPPAEPVAASTASRWWMWLFLLLLLPLLIWLAWRLLRKTNAREPTVVVSPREWALQELRTLRESGLAQRDVKQYYVTLTSIVRRYIERTTGIRAAEQTTEEFLREVTRRDDFPMEEKTSLQSFLESADLVKFAAQEPAAEDLAHSLERARGFVTVQRSGPLEVAG